VLFISIIIGGMIILASASMIWLISYGKKASLTSQIVLLFGVLSTAIIVYKYEPRDQRWLPENERERRIMKYFILIQISLLIVYYFTRYKLLFDYLITIIPTYLFTFMVGLLLFEEMILGKKSKRKPRKPSKISVTEEGDDQPWFGGWVYRLEEPFRRVFIRGYGSDMVVLSKIIKELVDKRSIMFYILYEPKKGTFEATINYSKVNGMYHQLFTHDRGQSLAVSCNTVKTIEWILSRYWIDEYICWIVAHDISYSNIAEIMHQTFNPDSFPKGFSDLIQNTFCFFRDVEYGDALEIITDKMNREEIKQAINTIK